MTVDRIKQLRFLKRFGEEIRAAAFEAACAHGSVVIALRERGAHELLAEPVYPYPPSNYAYPWPMV